MLVIPTQKLALIIGNVCTTETCDDTLECQYVPVVYTIDTCGDNGCENNEIDCDDSDACTADWSDHHYG